MIIPSSLAILSLIRSCTQKILQELTWPYAIASKRYCVNCLGRTTSWVLENNLVFHLIPLLEQAPDPPHSPKLTQLHVADEVCCSLSLWLNILAIVNQVNDLQMKGLKIPIESFQFTRGLLSTALNHPPCRTSWWALIETIIQKKICSDFLSANISIRLEPQELVRFKLHAL